MINMGNRALLIKQQAEQAVAEHGPAEALLMAVRGGALDNVLYLLQTYAGCDLYIMAQAPTQENIRDLLNSKGDRNIKYVTYGENVYVINAAAMPERLINNYAGREDWLDDIVASHDVNSIITLTRQNIDTIGLNTHNLVMAKDVMAIAGLKLGRALEAAIEADQFEIIECILKNRGQTVEAIQALGIGKMLAYAAVNNKLTTIQYILDIYKQDATLLAQIGLDLIVRAAAEYGRLDIIRFMLNTFDQASLDLQRALEGAARTNQYIVMRYLLDRYNVIELGAKEAFATAFYCKHFEAVRCILSHCTAEFLDLQRALLPTNEVSRLVIMRYVLGECVHSANDIENLAIDEILQAAVRQDCFETVACILDVCGRDAAWRKSLKIDQALILAQQLAATKEGFGRIVQHVIIEDGVKVQDQALLDCAAEVGLAKLCINIALEQHSLQQQNLKLLLDERNKKLIPVLPLQQRITELYNSVVQAGKITITSMQQLTTMLNNIKTLLAFSAIADSEPTMVIDLGDAGDFVNIGCASIKISITHGMMTIEYINKNSNITQVPEPIQQLIAHTFPQHQRIFYTHVVPTAPIESASPGAGAPKQ